MILLRGFLGAIRMHIRLYATHPVRIAQVVIRPALVSLLAVLVLRSHAQHAGYFRVLVGSVMAGLWTALLGTATFTIRREREWYGTLELLSGVPVPVGIIFGGYIIGETLIALIAVPVSSAVTVLASGANLHAYAVLSAVISFLVVALAMVAFALVIAPVMVLIPVLTRWVNAFDYPVWILAGFLFPVALLPGWSTPFSYGLSVYWGTESLQRAADGAAVADLLPLWFRGIGLSILYMAVSLVLFNAVMRKLREVGGLSHG
jgi:ABC-2 type transport system permease protein